MKKDHQTSGTFLVMRQAQPKHLSITFVITECDTLSCDPPESQRSLENSIAKIRSLKPRETL